MIAGLIVLAVSMVVGLLVAFTSYTDHPPNYHWVRRLCGWYVYHSSYSNCFVLLHFHCNVQAFSFFGFVMSIVWIYIITSEVVNVLEVSDLSESGVLRFNGKCCQFCG